MAKATAMAKEIPPIIIEGEMQANVGINEGINRDVSLSQNCLTLTH